MNWNIKAALIIGVALAVFIGVPLIWGGVWGWHGGWGVTGPWMTGGFGWGWWMPVSMVLFWGLVIWGVVELIRGAASPGRADPSGLSESAIEVLKKRYARGEISKEEYEEKKRDLA